MIGLGRRLSAEALGSLLLAGVVVGSGVLAERLAGGNIAIALLGNTLATAAILFVLVTALGPLSGAHLNPAVTLVAALHKTLPIGDALGYAFVQVTGCLAGVWLAHAMFGLPIVETSTHDRSGAAVMLSEGVATFALMFTILMVARQRPDALPSAVALVITAGYWWTASTSFANPAITIARSLTDTFSGVRPTDAPGLILAQFGGAVLASAVCTLLLPKEADA